MSWAAVAAGAATVISGAVSADAQKKAAKAGASQKGSTASSTEVTTMTGQQQGQFQNILDQLTNRVSNPSQQYSKENAMLDASYVAQNAANEVMKGVPQILSQASSSGAYSATGSQALINDLAQKATAVKAQTILDQINKYAQLDQQQNATNLSAILQAFQIASNSTKKEKSTGDTSGSSIGLRNTAGNSGFGAQESAMIGGAVGKLVGAYNEFSNGQNQAQSQAAWNSSTDYGNFNTTADTNSGFNLDFGLTPGG